MKNILKSILHNSSSEEEYSKELDTLQSKIKYKFKNKRILQAALTHTSLTTPNMESTPFERMEFLGDSILGLVISEALFLAFPNSREGKLSKIKSRIVSKKFLRMKSDKIDLGNSLILSSEAVNSGGRHSLSILGDAMESLICAIYLDGGLKNAKKFIISFIFEGYEEYITDSRLIDFKSRLQEYSQKNSQSIPLYKILKEEGPDHDKTFSVEVFLNDKCMGLGKGQNKKAAQQDAAHIALEKINTSA